jgi:hypothetical protein
VCVGLDVRSNQLIDCVGVEFAGGVAHGGRGGVAPLGEAMPLLAVMGLKLFHQWQEIVPGPCCLQAEWCVCGACLRAVMVVMLTARDL